MLVLSSSLDREVQAHKHFTNATNIYWLNELMRYVRSEGLLNNFRLYPMVARTNYGTGTTVRGLGRLTGNQMTLVNGPTWGASGIAFASASSQYGAIADFLGSETLTVWARSTVTSSLAAGAAIISQYDTGANQRSWMYYKSQTSPNMWLAISDDGTNLARYIGGNESTSTDISHVCQYASAGAVAHWLDKTSQSLTLDLGTARSSRHNSTASILINAFQSSGVPSFFADQTAHASAFLTGSVTTTQRETITDLINAL